MPLVYRHPAFSLALTLLATLILTLVIGAAASAATESIPLSCPNSQTIFLEGQSAPSEGLLIFLENRAVGGGSSDSSGRWRLPLRLSEKPGIYRIEVRTRASRAVVGRFTCYTDVPLDGVFTATSEIVATAAPSSTSGLAATGTPAAPIASLTATATRIGTPATATRTATAARTGTPATATRTGTPATATRTGTPATRTATATRTGTPGTATPTVVSGDEAEIQIFIIVIDDPQDSEDDGEYTEIANMVERDIDITGWRLINSTRSGNPTYTFSEFILEAGETLILFTDTENSGEDIPEYREFYWKRPNGDNVWRVDDIAELHDATGRLIHSYRVTGD